jgi:hypothetical protein
VPQPRDDAALMEDEDPLDSDAEEEFAELSGETAAVSEEEPEMEPAPEEEEEENPQLED